MSSPVRNDDGDELKVLAPTMYAPPWARDVVTEAADTALAATDKLRRALPPAPQLNEQQSQLRWRDPKPFEGDVAIRRMRERPSLDPVSVPTPPAQERGSPAAVLARVAGAISLAALAAFFVVGAMPQPLQGAANPDSAATKGVWSRLFGGTASGHQQVSPAPQPVAQRIAPVTEAAPLAERFAAIPQRMEAPPPAPAPQAVQPEQVAAPPPAPSLRTLDRSEIAVLYKRSEELVGQGDIAAARLMLTRAAEAGDARAALALGATYDASVLRSLGVLGVAADVSQARAWYSKAAEFGSSDAARRLEQMAQQSAR